MRKYFKDSLKALEADIQHANTLASDYPREYDGGCLQMRLSYSPCAHIFLFLVQWGDCNIAGALGLLRILIYKAYEDGKTTMYIHERKATIKEFYGWIRLWSLVDPHHWNETGTREPAIDQENKQHCTTMGVYSYFAREKHIEAGKSYPKLFSCICVNLINCFHKVIFQRRSLFIVPCIGLIFPSLQQLQRGITDVEDRKQKELCAMKYRRRDEMNKGKLTESEIEREEECGICLELNSKVVLPVCNHSLCMKCYWNWRTRSQSCPFCRDSLKRVNSEDLWIYTASCDIVDLSAIARENLKRLLIYIEGLPLIVPDPSVVSYDPLYYR